MKLSVALCTYNGEKYLKQQIDSIIAQNVAVDEIIVCDDGSTDATWEILQAYHTAQPEVFRIYRNPQNLKLVKNFEKAINLCSGDLVFLSDQDDLWDADKTRVIKEYFQENADKDAVFHDLNLMADDRLLETTNWDALFFAPEQLEKLPLKDRLLFWGNVVTGAGFAFRNLDKKHFDITKKDFLHDYQLALDFVLSDKLGYLEKRLGSYRLHGNQVVGPKIEKRAARVTEIDELFFKLTEEKPEEQIRFFSYYNKYWNFYRQHSVISNYLKKKMKKPRQKFLSQFSFIERKKILLSWYLKKKYFVTISDLLSFK